MANLGHLPLSFSCVFLVSQQTWDSQIHTDSLVRESLGSAGLYLTLSVLGSQAHPSTLTQFLCGCWWSEVKWRCLHSRYVITMPSLQPWNTFSSRQIRAEDVCMEVNCREHWWIPSGEMIISKVVNRHHLALLIEMKTHFLSFMWFTFFFCRIKKKDFWLHLQGSN